MHFPNIKTAVARQFERMQQAGPLFRVDVGKDELWATYLGSFPEGANPIFRERTEHDCSCCKGFIRAVGNVVAVIDGRLETIWDQPAGDYGPVMDAMAALVRSKPLTEIFLHESRTVGADKTFEDVVGQVKTWEHFHVNLKPEFVAKRSDIPTKLGEARSSHDVILRGLCEIKPDAVETVLDLIAQGSLYRGEEHKAAVEAFRTQQRAFNIVRPLLQDLMAWTITLRIRNTVIGSLLIDLSEGRDIEAAVGSFEAKVAPTNYKRPKSLVTQRQIDEAKATVEGLGLTSALERRYARVDDITANNILFADRTARVAMGGAFDDLPTKPGAQNFDKVEEISIDRFLADVLPRAEGLEVLVENRHVSNFVSLVAPVDPTAGRLFKWDNGFSWSYTGEVADAIKERVKKAGGNVTGDLCCRLAWSNRDDLDFHMREPGGGHIYYGNRGLRSPAGGMLDVDANGGSGMMKDPVENIFYASRQTMREGVYELSVHQFSKRETKDVGFEAEIDFLGTIHRFAHPADVTNGRTVLVAKFKYSHAAGVEIIESLPASTISRQAWGIASEAFQKVNVVMLSPNHWDGQGVGNRHLFFMLDGCKNEDTARGFYNEFLRADLEQHRKVFEIVGAKMKVGADPHQLSGLGFSSTAPNTLVCRVKGSFNRTIRVQF